MLRWYVSTCMGCSISREEWTPCRQSMLIRAGRACCDPQVWAIWGLNLCSVQATFLEGLGIARSELGDTVTAHPRLMSLALRTHLAGLCAAGIPPGALGDALARHPQLQGYGAENQARARALEATANMRLCRRHACSAEEKTRLLKVSWRALLPRAAADAIRFAEAGP